MNPAPETGRSDDATPRKLHPVTLLQRFLISLPGFAAVLFATWRSPDSGNWVTLVVTIIYAVVALPLIYLRYQRFSYWITSTELVIRSGVLTRQHRNIPLEKIQNVEIVQRLLPRLTSTARVQVVTAGSSSAEGVLEFVSLKEAERIRSIVRDYSRTAAERLSRVRRASGVHGSESVTAGESNTKPWADEAESTTEDKRLLLDLGLGRVLLSGAYRFSLLYIAIIFSLIQFFQPDPEVLAEWLLREQYDPVIEAVRASPLIAVTIAVVTATLLSWLSGILVNLNKYFRFKLWSEPGKVSKRSGLLTLSEGTVPTRKIQAVIATTNPVMKARDWWTISVQTMGLDVRGEGYTVVAPFVHWAEFESIRPRLIEADLDGELRPVSRRRFGRLTSRYVLAVGALSIALRSFWVLWWIVLPLIPILALVAWGQWRAHRFAVGRDALIVRRGLVRKKLWVLPFRKMQVFYTTQSIFQRRRDLRSVYVDTAGASTLSTPTVYDLRTADALALVEAIYERFDEETGDAGNGARVRESPSRRAGMAT